MVVAAFQFGLQTIGAQQFGGDAGVLGQHQVGGARGQRIALADGEADVGAFGQWMRRVDDGAQTKMTDAQLLQVGGTRQGEGQTDIRLAAGHRVGAEDDAVAADPRGWIAQPVMQLSTVPTKIGGEVRPRHVDLRPFAVNDGESVCVLPCGLTLVALSE